MFIQVRIVQMAIHDLGLYWLVELAQVYGSARCHVSNSIGLFFFFHLYLSLLYFCGIRCFCFHAQQHSTSKHVFAFDWFSLAWHSMVYCSIPYPYTLLSECIRRNFVSPSTVSVYNINAH